MTAMINVAVNAATVPFTPVAPRVPVILLNGFQLVCLDDSSTLEAAVSTFGQLPNYLEDDGVPVVFFNNCAYEIQSIEQLGGQLGAYIAALHYPDGTPVQQVDLVAHSMGGLVARAYLSGRGPEFWGLLATRQRQGSQIGHDRDASFRVLPSPLYRSAAIRVGTRKPVSPLGSRDVEPGTGRPAQGGCRFRSRDHRQRAGTYGTSSNASDRRRISDERFSGFRSAGSARTRIVPYCHVTPSLVTVLGMSCYNNWGIAEINNADHPSSKIVRSFLADTTEWQSVGYPPSMDPFLSRYGGTLLALLERIEQRLFHGPERGDAR